MTSSLIDLHRLIDLALWPLSGLAPGWGLAFVTLLLTAFALVVYKYTSSQEGIKRAKERIKAHFVEVWLYIDDPVLILKAQAGIFANGGRYLAYALVPLAVMFLPVMILLVNLEHRYDYRPFKPGENILLKVRFNPRVSDWSKILVLNSKGGIELAGSTLRISGRDEKGNEFNEIDYQLKAPAMENAFTRPVQLLVKDKPVGLVYIFVQPAPVVRVNPQESARFWPNFLRPGYTSVDPDYISGIEISYPRADLNFFGWKTWWVWPCLILMFVFAFALKPFLKVEF